MAATVFIVLCGLSIVLCFIPLLWHIKVGNVPAICLIIWLTIYNLFSLVNAVIWGGNNIYNTWDGQWYCDVHVKIIVGEQAGTMGAVICIARNLAQILSQNQQVIMTRKQKRRRIWRDCAWCIGLPVVMMGLHYIVQPSRYWILGVTGCTPTVDNSWPSIVLVFIWPPIIATVAGWQAVLVLFRLYRYRKEFTSILNTTQTNVTKSRFFRLFCLALSLVVIYLPISWYIFYRNVSLPRIPYSWKLVHGIEWSFIVKVPTNGQQQFDRWIGVGAGYLLFLFFGMGTDAMALYKGLLLAVGCNCCVARKSGGTGSWSWNRSEGTFGSRAAIAKGYSVYEMGKNHTNGAYRTYGSRIGSGNDFSRVESQFSQTSTIITKHRKRPEETDTFDEVDEATHSTEVSKPAPTVTTQAVLGYSVRVSQHPQLRGRKDNGNYDEDEDYSAFTTVPIEHLTARCPYQDLKLPSDRDEEDKIRTCMVRVSQDADGQDAERGIDKGVIQPIELLSC